MFDDNTENALIVENVYRNATEDDEFSLATIPTYLTAAGFDLASSVWNTFAPSDYETSTSELLQDQGLYNVEEFYQDNKWGVELGSLLGGGLISGFGVGAVINALRVGRMASLAYNPFGRLANNAARNKQKTVDLLASGVDNTRDYKKALWGFKGAIAAEGAAAGLTQEAAFLALMQEHPWMEDYGVGTFLLGAGLYNLGLPLKYLSEKKQIFSLGNAIQRGQLSGINPEEILFTQSFKGIDDPMDALANRIHRIQTQEQHLNSSNPVEGFKIKTLNENRTQDIAQALRELRAMSKGSLSDEAGKFFGAKDKPRALPDEVDELDSPAIVDLYNFLHKDPTITSLQGVKELREFSFGSKLGNISRNGNPITDESLDGAKKFWEDISLSGPVKPGDTISNTYSINQSGAVFDPITKTILSTDEAIYALRAGDLSRKLDPIKDIKLNSTTTFSGNTALADKRFLDTYAGINTIDKSKFSRSIIDENDLPMLDAIIHMDTPPASVNVRINGTVEQLTVDRVKDHVKQYKTAKVNELSSQGFYDEQIGIYLNMPLESVVGTKLGRNVTDFSFHKSATSEYANKILNKKKVLLEGNDLATQNALNARPATILDAETLRNINGARATTQFAHPETPEEMVDYMNSYLSSDGWRELDTHMADFLSRVGAGNRLVTSSDFALRNLGKLGEFAGAQGAALKNFADNLISKYIRPSAPIVDLIRRDKTQSVMMEQFLNRYHSHTRGELNASRYDSGRGVVVLREADPENSIDEVLMKWDNGADMVIDGNSGVGKFISQWQDGQNKLLTGMANLNRRLNDPDATPYSGLYFPYTPLSDDSVGYIFNKSDPTKSKIFTAKTPEDLNQLAEVAKKNLKPGEEVVLRGKVGDWELAHGYAREGGEWLQNANPELVKAGIGRINVSATGDSLLDLMDSFSGDVAGYLRGITRKTHTGLFERLNTISKSYADELASGNKSLRNSRELDYGTVLNATLLNKSLLSSENFPLTSTANTWFEVGVNKALNGFRNSKIQLTGKGEISPEEFTRLGNELSDLGVPNPYRSIQDYAAHNLPQFKNLSGDVIANSTGLMAALNLRVLEAAHGAVTTLTIPITTLSVLRNEKSTTPFRHLYKGLSMFFKDDPLTNAIRARGEKFGFTQMRLVELMDSFSQMHQTNKINRVLNSDLMKFLSKPSDWAEHFARQSAYYTGMSLALERDPGLATRLLAGKGLDSSEAFANYFTQRTMGNYTPSQRPVMFQGQLGHVLSVYQTFMLTMMQNAFKFMEDKDRRAMLTAVGAQMGMFGSTSLPGAEYLSQQIGAHVLQDNQDIKSTAYRLFGDTSVGGVNLAEGVLFGFPSAMFNQGLSSRGNLDPRLPFSVNHNGLGTLPPVVSSVIQLGQLASNAGNLIAGTLSSDGSAMDYAKAMNQAIAMQSISRPLRGIAELFQGYSTDNKGEVVADNSLEELSNLGRAVGLRPLKEHVLRSTRYTNRRYDAIDYSNRQRSISSLRRLMNGDTDLNFNSILGEYLDNGGTATGWKSSVNRVFKEANVPMAERLKGEISRSPMMDYILDTYTL